MSGILVDRMNLLNSPLVILHDVYTSFDLDTALSIIYNDKRNDGLLCLDMNTNGGANS